LVVGAVEKAGNLGPVVINPIILAEVSVGFDFLAELERLLDWIEIAREALPFLAGRAHATYRRRRGGARVRTLPDFFIGAHAEVKGHRLLTRDPRRYRRYLPDLDIIASDTNP
jgi:predicted nucleic acid-binding protein